MSDVRKRQPISNKKDKFEIRNKDGRVVSHAFNKHSRSGFRKAFSSASVERKWGTWASYTELYVWNTQTNKIEATYKYSETYKRWMSL